MFGIIFPVVAIPLFLTLIAAEVRANRSGLLAGIPSPVRSLTKGHLWLDFFWQIDLVGLLIIAAIFSFILVPLTLAGGN
jgi:SIT family siderophore-iron:H+ symporter-like MFS transporter